MATAAEFSLEKLKEANARSLAQGITADRCPRCGGLMVAEPCQDLLDGSSGSLDFGAWRCVQCGEIIDSVILQNRQRQPASGLGTNQRNAVFPRSEERS